MAPATLTRPISSAAATASEGMPRANVHGGQFPDDKFENVPNVPVFVEHETTIGEDENARQAKFGLDELKAIAGRCNQRIRETGDYAMLTLGHTPKPEDRAKGAPDPEVVGVAGPFTVGVIGNQGERQRYAILANFHVFKEDWPRVRKKFGRRSPELWFEDRADEMFLDPIALLGAQAPRLDMGLAIYEKADCRVLYQAERNGRQVERYAAAFGGAMNTFTPTTDVLRDDGQKKNTRRTMPRNRLRPRQMEPAL